METSDDASPKDSSTSDKASATSSAEEPTSEATEDTEPTEAGTDSSTKTPLDDMVHAVTDAAHAIVGFGVISWNKTQVRRREWLKGLNVQRHQVESHLDGAKEQVASTLRHLDAKFEPVRHDIDDQLDKLSDRLPEQVRDIVTSARKLARDAERQVRQAVGAL